jgi:hypothetical protein
MAQFQITLPTKTYNFDMQRLVFRKTYAIHICFSIRQSVTNHTHSSRCLYCRLRCSSTDNSKEHLALTAQSLQHEKSQTYQIAHATSTSSIRVTSCSLGNRAPVSFKNHMYYFTESVLSFTVSESVTPPPWGPVYLCCSNH